MPYHRGRPTPNDVPIPDQVFGRSECANRDRSTIKRPRPAYFVKHPRHGPTPSQHMLAQKHQRCKHTFPTSDLADGPVAARP